MKENNQPIGIFDSGVGGLTVASEIIKALPHENIIYLGDTARVPYGTRSREVITEFALELVRFLVNKKVKCLVIACNTISSISLKEIKKISPVPVIDVISPTLKAARNQGRVGVIGTRGAISAGAYARGASVAVACPLFVFLAEEGMTSGVAAEEIARGYLLALKKAKINTLILGCTHFPLLRAVIAKTMSSKVKLVESGPPTAKYLRQFLQKNGLSRKSGKPKYEFYFTDNPGRVTKVAANFFGKKLPGKIVKIEL